MLLTKIYITESLQKEIIDYHTKFFFVLPDPMPPHIKALIEYPLLLRDLAYINGMYIIKLIYDNHTSYQSPDTIFVYETLATCFLMWAFSQCLFTGWYLEIYGIEYNYSAESYGYMYSGEPTSEFGLTGYRLCRS